MKNKKKKQPELDYRIRNARRVRECYQLRGLKLRLFFKFRRDKSLRCTYFPININELLRIPFKKKRRTFLTYRKIKNVEFEPSAIFSAYFGRVEPTSSEYMKNLIYKWNLDFSQKENSERIERWLFERSQEMEKIEGIMIETNTCVIEVLPSGTIIQHLPDEEECLRRYTAFLNRNCLAPQKAFKLVKNDKNILTWEPRGDVNLLYKHYDEREK